MDGRKRMNVASSDVKIRQQNLVNERTNERYLRLAAGDATLAFGPEEEEIPPSATTTLSQHGKTQTTPSSSSILSCIPIAKHKQHFFVVTLSTPNEYFDVEREKTLQQHCSAERVGKIINGIRH